MTTTTVVQASTAQPTPARQEFRAAIAPAFFVFYLSSDPEVQRSIFSAISPAELSWKS